VASVTSALGIAVPESLVVALPQSSVGEISGSRAHTRLREHAEKADAMLVGPGMSSGRAAHAMLAPLVPRLRDDATLVLDAAAIFALRRDATLLEPLEGRAVLTPHAGEMATLLSVDIGDVEASPAAMAQEAAARYGAVVALKGAESWIAEPDGTLYHYTGGSVGLATSGSGDTLAGIVAGLAARGASAVTACVWSVYLHGTAGRVLARRVGRVGFLARELLDEVPRVMHGMS
jgi:ADP-dependent NAD(P)H-hydrate dehydratase